MGVKAKFKFARVNEEGEEWSLSDEIVFEKEVEVH